MDLSRPQVLHVVATGERRGAEVFASDLVRALDGMGLQQCVAVVRGAAPFPVQFAAPVEALGARGRGIPGVHMDLRAVRRLQRLVRVWRPTIVHTHGGETLKYTIAATRAVPIIARWIGLAPSWVTRGPRRFAYAQMLRRARRVAAIADVVRRQLITTFEVPGDRVVTIVNGVDPQRMVLGRGPDAIRAELGITPDAMVLLSICALTWEKDPLTHVEVARRLDSERSDLIHLIAGDGPMRSRVADAIDGLDLTGRTLLLGNRPDIGDLLAASDVVLFASRSDGMEGMPTIAIEAGMVGVPVAGYAVAGLSEVVEDGATGLLAPVGDLNGLVTAVRRLLGEGGLRRRLGTAARERCLARFGINPIARQHLDLYMETLDATSERTAY